MALIDEIRARRGDRHDPFDQEAARREYKRAGAPPERAESEDAARGELERSHTRREALNRRRKQAISGGRRVASNTAMVATGARRPINVPGEGAGILLGLIGYALMLNFIRGGPGAVTGWLGAKFLNIPYTGTKVGPNSPAATKPTPPAYPQATGRAAAPLEHPVPATPYAPTFPGSGDFTQSPPTPRGA